MGVPERKNFQVALFAVAVPELVEITCQEYGYDFSKVISTLVDVVV